MPVHTEWVRFGRHDGYLARPERATLPLPAVVVIQEIWGVDEHIEDVTRRIAAAGYAAFAPDLYAEGGVRPAPLVRERVGEVQAFLAELPPGTWGDESEREGALRRRSEAEQRRIRETFARLFGSAEAMPRFVPPLRDAVRHLRDERAETGAQSVACVGFCMGGSLAALLACEEPELAGAAVYYGRTPPEEKLVRVRCPVIAFYGAEDTGVNAGIAALAAGMERCGRPFEHHVYAGAGHSFFNDTRPSYEVRAARDSFARLLGFLAGTLAGG